MQELSKETNEAMVIKAVDPNNDEKQIDLAEDKYLNKGLLSQRT